MNARFDPELTLNCFNLNIKQFKYWMPPNPYTFDLISFIKLSTKTPSFCTYLEIGDSTHCEPLDSG